MAERIRDATVAEAISAEAGTDATPELVLSEVVSPVILLQQRPPLASSGYFPGTIGMPVSAVADNTSHAGIFISGIGQAIGRVNWIRIFNTTAGVLNFTLRRVNAPFTGFPSVRAVPGYISAGGLTTGTVFSVTKTDTVGPSGISMAAFEIQAASDLHLLGPWIIDNGLLLVTCNTVNTGFRFAAGYEVWPAIRSQPLG